MRGDNLKIHMKKHVGEMKNVDEVETHRSGACGEIRNVDGAETHSNGTSSVKCTNINFEKLEKNVLSHADE